MSYERKKYDVKKAKKLSSRPQRLLSLYGGYYYEKYKKRYMRCSHDDTKSFAKTYFSRKNRRLANKMIKKEEFNNLPTKKSNDLWMFD